MNRLAVYSYLTRFAREHGGCGDLFTESLPGRGWLHVYKQEMMDKTDTEHGMTITRSHSRQAVNSLCATMQYLISRLCMQEFPVL